MSSNFIYGQEHGMNFQRVRLEDLSHFIDV
jgi:hypothetical protein